MSDRANTRVVVRLVTLVAFMGAMSLAAVPFYNWFCSVTGYGGTTTVASTASGEILDQTIKIRFDASLDSKMEWRFKPVQRTMEMRIGEVGLAFYEAHNPTDRVIAGTASYNVTPFTAGEFFTKIDCFCFTEQVLQPGETAQMPVTLTSRRLLAQVDSCWLISIRFSLHPRGFMLPGVVELPMLVTMD